ncbi:FecR family protein [Reichenbachiella agariperforans]|uniref:FecR family protein n=1 Tax=Reichenbachiella agariperforans TaxID=156994 RepID=UPI001C093E91|nr:FecR domain-containing protein [Reichenbachiella agariperforans]MBU2913564.1 FecR domain-containing protein [Reichenbachiella agariperforans]
MQDHHWQLIAKQLKGELTPSEQQEWQDWLDKSETNQTQYEQAKVLWQTKSADSKLNDAEFLQHIQSDSAQVWQGILSQIDTPQRQHTSYAWIYKVAAMLAVTLGLAWTVLRHNTALLTGQTHFETTNFTDSTYLPDSTHVWLNKHTSISYGDFSGETREVTLDGEAFFEVTRDEQKPFIVKTNHAQIQVLGTSFNINSHGDLRNESLTVASGKVAYSTLKKPDQSIELVKNEHAILTSHTLLPVKTSMDPNFLAWKSGILLFENNDLDYVQKILSDYYDLEIIITDEDILSKRLTATFERMTAEESIQVICNLYGLQKTQQNNTITLAKK